MNELMDGSERQMMEKEYRNGAELKAMAYDPQIAAERAISARSKMHERLDNMPVQEGAQEQLKSQTIRRIAAEDLEDLRKIKMHEHLDNAAVIIHENMKNTIYRVEFERIDPEAAKTVELLAAQAGERLVPEVLQQNTMTIESATPELLAAVQERDAEEARKVLGVQRDENQVSEKFVSDLDSRMEKAQLEELGWRNRDDLDDVMRDMERLASLDWQRAAKLWDKYRPDDIDKPIFIDGDDVDEKKPDRGTPLPQDEVSQDNIPDTKRRDIHENESLILESLRKRFLQAENKFYFRDTENKLAFEDHGKRLATEHNDPEIIRSMVDLAEAKGWTSINLKGADEFKREVWLQASLKGMEVTGFKPQSVDLARLNDLRSEINIPRKPLNTIDQAVEREAVVDEQKQTLSKQQRTAIEALQTILRSRGDSEKVVEMASTTAAERFLTNRVHVGKIIDHGTAPYDNNTDNEQSYFVQIQNKDMSEKTVWGVDLKRAVEESNAAIGSDVVLAYQGRQQVTVKVKERDEQGNMTGTKDIIANRNTWDVKQIETMREEAIRHFTAIASNTRQPQVMVYDNTAPRAQVRPEISREMFREPELSR